jgi:predicted transposase/invertase (TIGR01784 family)
MIINYEAAEKIQMDNLSALRQSHLEGVEIGREEGIALGEERGKIEEKKDIARNLLKIGLPIDQIVLATDLSKQEIESLEFLK